MGKYKSKAYLTFDVDGGERPQYRRPRKCLCWIIVVPNSCTDIANHGANAMVLKFCLTTKRNRTFDAIRVRVRQ